MTLLHRTKLSAPTAILFDWDNTLVDTWPTIHAALNATLTHMNHPAWSLEKVKANVKKSMRDSFPEMFGNQWEIAAEHFQTTYRAIHLDNLTPLPDALTMLEYCAAHGIAMGIVSNKRGPSLRAECAHLGWEHFFGATIGSTDAPRDKPYPDPALLALARMGVALSEQVWFIGDTVVDLECAQGAGLTAILYGKQKGTDQGHFEGAPFAYHTPHHHDLIATLEHAAHKRPTR